MIRKILLLTTVLALTLIACSSSGKNPKAKKPPKIDMVWISAGTFTMGSPKTEAGRYNWEDPQHRVQLTNGFYMGKYIVTQEQYLAVMGVNPSSFHEGDGREPVSGEIQKKRPVNMVSWYDAIVFCNKLSIMSKLTPAYSINGSVNPADWGKVPTSRNAAWNAVQIVADSNGYRLPTGAQWEYACRAGTTTAYNTGAAISDNTGWYNVNSNAMTRQVGLKPANAWGLYDMHGNLWEWSWDWFGANSAEAKTDPMGASSGSARVIRGGSWGSPAEGLRSAGRFYSDPAYRGDGLGFRLVRP